jgi:hypothetical protein
MSSSLKNNPPSIRLVNFDHHPDEISLLEEKDYPHFFIDRNLGEL